MERRPPMAEVWEHVAGFRHWSGVPRCPCADPGNYFTMEQNADDPLRMRMTCWCGRSLTGSFDDPDERSTFLADNGIDPATIGRP